MRKGRFCSREGSDLFNARVSGQFGSISKKEGDKRSTTWALLPGAFLIQITHFVWKSPGKWKKIPFPCPVRRESQLIEAIWNAKVSFLSGAYERKSSCNEKTRVSEKRSDFDVLFEGKSTCNEKYGVLASCQRWLTMEWKKTWRSSKGTRSLGILFKTERRKKGEIKERFRTPENRGKESHQTTRVKIRNRYNLDGTRLQRLRIPTRQSGFAVWEYLASWGFLLVCKASSLRRTSF